MIPREIKTRGQRSISSESSFSSLFSVSELRKVFSLLIFKRVYVVNILYVYDNFLKGKYNVFNVV